MKRHILIEIDLTDEELARIVPSSKVYVIIHSTSGSVSDTNSEILSVRDIKDS